MAVRKSEKSAFFCRNCGAEHPKWQGQCRDCGEWNSLIEERVVKTGKKRIKSNSSPSMRLPDITEPEQKGFLSGISELDRVLGGQLLPGMVVLLGGEPGIGKSTLLLQAAGRYGESGLNTLYVTGEESLPQLKRRSVRLGVNSNRIQVANTTALDDVVNLIAGNQYQLVLIDSIQTLSSSDFDSPPGTVGQVREVASQLITLAKAGNFALFLVGHVTKEGLVAGPKVLEHMVDTVIYFEGDNSHLYRVLRAAKNRFGSVAEIGVFEMSSEGLQEVTNPSLLFLGKHATPRSGAVASGLCEGQRPLMIEIQALVTAANYGNPQRVAGGVDHRKLALLLAILEKRGGYPMGTHDVFVSVAGGLRVTEPALDLAIVAAIVSSLTNNVVDHRTLVIGEVGLSGEIRPVVNYDLRIGEAAKLGFKRAIVPESNAEQSHVGGMEIIPVADVQAALEAILD